MLSKFSTSVKLYILILITAVSLIGLGLYGINDLKKMEENTRTLYSDRVLCMQQLANIRFEYVSEIYPVARKVENHELTFKEAKAQVQEAVRIISTNWVAYKHSYFTPEEQLLVKQTDEIKKQTDEESSNLESVLSNENTVALNNLIQKDYAAKNSPFVLKLTQLMELQLQVAKQIFDNNQEIFKNTSVKFFLLIVLSLVVALSLSFYIIKNIKGLIKDVLDSNSTIKESNEKLRKADARFKAIVENVFVGIKLNAADWKIIYRSPSMQAINGWTDDVMNRNYDELIHPDDLEMVKRTNREVLLSPGKTINSTYRLMHKNGDYIWIDSMLCNKLDDPDLEAIITVARDITDRKKAEELILREKMLSDAIINSLPGVFYLRNSKGEFVRWNKNFETLTGYNADEVKKLNAGDMIVKEDRERVKESIEKVFSNGYATTEAKAITKDGTELPFLFSASFITYENEPCLLGTGFDISSRIKAEEEVKSSEQKYKLLFDSNPLPLWMIAKDDYSIIAVNDAAACLYGYTKEELLQTSVNKMRPAEDLPAQLKSYQKKLTGATDFGIVKHVKKDGTIIFVNIISQDIIFEDKLVRLSLTNDVTEKLKADELLKKSEANLKTIMDTTDTAYALLDKDLHVMAFNQMAVKFVNKQFHHIPEKGNNLIDYFPIERLSQFTSYAAEVLKGNNISYEANYPQADGSVLWYYVRLFPITNKKNEIFGLMLALSDITERKGAEESLKMAYSQIQDHITSITDMAWKQSHLIRSPLANLKGLTMMLQDDPSDADVLGFIQDELERMDAIIIEMAEDASK